jgi:hypothetical protein
LNAFIEQKVPKDVRHQVKLIYKFRGQTVTLGEERLGHMDRWVTHNVAQFRLDKATKEWSVYWRDSRDRWPLYDDIEPGADFEKLLQLVDRNPVIVVSMTGS